MDRTWPPKGAALPCTQVFLALKKKEEGPWARGQEAGVRVLGWVVTKGFSLCEEWAQERTVGVVLSCRGQSPPAPETYLLRVSKLSCPGPRLCPRGGGKAALAASLGLPHAWAPARLAP